MQNKFIRIRQLASTPGRNGAPDRSELWDLLRETGEYRGQFNSRRAGRWIARKEGRIVNGMRFERDANKSGGSERWRVVVMADMSANSQHAGGDDEYEGCDLV